MTHAVPLRTFLARFFCALALIAASAVHAYGHGLPLVGPSEDRSAYALPDGTIPVICSVSGSGDEPAGTGLQLCVFCLTAGSIILPAPCGTLSHIERDVVVADAVPAVILPPVSPYLIAGHLSRGPPVA
ncbi:MAG: hypothetical protein AAGL24_18460 [Pseudomonadota bacterium]